MSIEIKKHVIAIADEQYTVLSDESELLVAQAVAQLNEVIGAVAQGTSFSDKRRMITLAALHLSIQLIQVKSQINAIEQAQRAMVCAIEETVL